MDEKKRKFAESIVSYVRDQSDWGNVSKSEAALAAVMVILDDIGSAQACLDVLGVPYDLYEGRVTTDKETEHLRRWKKEAIEVLEGWNHVWEVAGRPGPLGRSQSENVAYEIIRLQGHQSPGTAPPR